MRKNFTFLWAIFMFSVASICTSTASAQVDTASISETLLRFAAPTTQPVTVSVSEATTEANLKNDNNKRRIAYKKGAIYAFWGWNRGYYSNSNIRFMGDGYDFKLYDVKATDRPSDINYHNYLQIDRITIPQTNFRVGYFIKDNLALSIGVDHMKYVMVQNQFVRAKGNIPYPGYGTNFDQKIPLSESFLTFEHTDGLNYINAEIEYFYKAYEYKIMKLNLLAGAGIGFMLPKTNSQLFSRERHDDFNIAGYGTSIKLGAEIKLWDLFFIRTEGKEGFINMPNIRTTVDKSDKAKQHFWFTQWNYTFGFSFHI